MDRKFSRPWLRNRSRSGSPVDTIGPLGLRPLHLSAEPLVDLVFVHGLRGGSIKTWCKGTDPKLYWPQNWLPLDPDFQSANIHSFGYNADFRDTKDSILNVYDFGRTLLGEMRNSPHIRKRKTNPVILIGHSMGGLVLKVAYTLARQDVRNPEFGERIRCLFFLATPHRGSDFAALLNSALRISVVLSAKPYIGDLERNSASAQIINDDFRRYISDDDVSCWSFYETVKTSMVVTSNMIVDKESAILGFGQETIQYLNGGHRDICKFDHREDPNYITVKNALATAISGALKEVHISSGEKYRVQTKCLRAYLNISDKPEDDLANQKEIKAAGSCRWLEEREDFKAWRDVLGDTLVEKHDKIPQYYWAKINRTQYWVIDALDECVNHAEFFRLLSNVETAFPLRILVTSRITPEIQSHFLRVGENVVCTEIDNQDSMKDIEAYIQARIETLPLDGSREKRDLAGRILTKSGGCFLWVHLVLDQLSSVYTDKSIWTVLDEIPEGMVPFYQRTIEIMSQNIRDVELAKAILLWTVYCVRPLQISELQQALELDIGANVLSIKKTIEGLCGQLVYVDKIDIVHLVHPTAREFLIRDTASRYAVPKQKGHERIALSCLKYLSSNEMKSPRNRRLLNVPRGEVSVFREYACANFSEHIFSAFPEADIILSALDIFLRTNVLSWIEHVANKGTLYYVSRTAKNLGGYLGRRAKYSSPLGSQVERVDEWVTDLTRLVAKFGVALTTLPSAIHFLIPPLCPTTSATFKQFASSPDGLVLNGVTKIIWEDCISWTDFTSSATSIASGDKAFAVGMVTGSIEIYNQGNCQWERTIQHHEHIDILKFESSGHFLASAGIQSLKVWDVCGNELWMHKLKSRCIELSFQANSITGVSMNGNVTTWNLKSGNMIGESHRYLHKEPEDEFGKSQVKAPSISSISPDFQIIAVGTRKADVCLWSLQDSDLIGWCSIPEADIVTLVLFNPDPNICILAVAYNSSRLATFDPWSQEMLQSVKSGNGHQPVASLASSPDGRTLASVDSCGTMQVWDFETLSLLYQVDSSILGFRIVDFSSNGLRILDLMDSRLRVWEPAVLIRKTMEEDNSVSDAAILPAIHGQDEFKERQGITALICHPTLSAVFVGRYNGTVSAYDSRTGKEDATLYVHSIGAFVTALAVGPHDILASGDVNGNVQVWQLKISPTRNLRANSQLLTISTGKAIRQLLISPDGDLILISTLTSTSVLSLKTGACIGDLENSPTGRHLGRWLTRIYTQPEILHICGDEISRYSWDNFPSLQSLQALILPPDCQQVMRDTAIQSALLDSGSQNLIINFRQNHHEDSRKALFILSIGTSLSLPLNAQSSTTPILLASNPTHLYLGGCIKYFLGFSGSRLLFIDHASWLSTVELKAEPTTTNKREYTRHFFVPNEFVDRESGILPVLSSDRDVVFAVGGELAIVRNGLKFQHVTCVSELGQRF